MVLILTKTSLTLVTSLDLFKPTDKPKRPSSNIQVTSEKGIIKPKIKAIAMALLTASCKAVTRVPGARLDSVSQDQMIKAKASKPAIPKVVITWKYSLAEAVKATFQ